MLYEAERGDISIAVAGDAMIARRMRVFREPPFLRLMELVRDADVSIANLEFLFHHYESSWGWSHGTYTRSDPRMLDELKWMGFDGVFTANNHAFDFSEGGFLTTLEHLDQYDIPHAGGGRDLDHARAPGYVDSARGRVALLCATSTFAEVSRAGAGRPDFPGRPGVSTLRRQNVHYVPRDIFEALKKTSLELGFEAHAEAIARFGFTGRQKPIDKNRTVKLLDGEFRLGEAFRTETSLNEEDVESIGRWIRGASKQADWVVYGLHTHESGDEGEYHGGARTSPPGFMTEFAHWTIDQGCDLFAGHGPHYLRGIEIYKGRPIFYSLGNFILQNETVPWLPHESYRNFGLSDKETPGDYFEARSDGGKRGFPADPVFWQSVLPVCHYKSKRLHEVRLYPIDLGFGRPIPQRGRPMLAEGKTAQEVLDWLRELSKPFGTRIAIEGDIGVIRIQNGGDSK
jgi:poly-gamma-glutamate capsule biosynthesis protein CapA/YwtB (metallophosphatase superfamily)